ncbi:TrmH family RNA methyltransferase [Spirillospora sp. NPDC050679]
MGETLRITRRNARFQQWQALLSNRNKRQRAGEFLVQGVRPITLAVEHGWPVRALVYNAERSLSRWASDLLDATGGERVAMTPELIGELSDKDEDVPELLAVIALPEDDPARVTAGPGFLGLVFDRPTTPGNIGSMVRSADAFGGAGVFVTGHAADPYDPKSVRASTGSLFAVPVVRTRSHREVLQWAAGVRAEGVPLTVVGTDEHGTADIADLDLTGPVLLAIGNETAGLSAGWREECDVMARIPITGAASSLNAANAATVVLYEAARQRAAAART